MKRVFNTEIGGKKLKLGLSFGTSLDLLDEVGSPSEIMQEILADGFARSQQQEATRTKSRFNERFAVELLVVANRDYEGLDFDEMGELVFKHGFLQAFGIIVDYLSDMVAGDSTDRTEVEEFVQEAGEESVDAKN